MARKPPNAQTDDNHHYNCSDDSDHANATGPGKTEVIIPEQLSEFGPGAARALLHLIAEVHRKRATRNEQSAEGI